LSQATLVSAILAPAFRANAIHMTARFALAAAVWAVTVVGAGSERDRRRIVLAVVVSGRGCRRAGAGRLPRYPGYELAAGPASEPEWQ
jgi:hypothetical protein